MRLSQQVDARVSPAHSRNRAWKKCAFTCWTVLLAALFAMHLWHLRADFPNFSPWMDYSKYTDEGWYANAAVRYRLFGHWLLPGDFNPAVALPVWPCLLNLVFHFTGVSVVTARAVAVILFGGTVALTYGLVKASASRWAAMAAATLMLTSPFLFAFSRLALLEPLMVVLLLLSWRLGLALHEDQRVGRRCALLVAIGTLLSLIVLTKTTGIGLLPSTLWVVFARTGGARAWRRSLAAAGLAVVVCAGWLGLHLAGVFAYGHREDFTYLFVANAWEKPVTLAGKGMAYGWAAHGLLWAGTYLVCLCALALAVGWWRSRELRGNPLVPACLLVLVGTVTVIGWQNHPQPRYYAVVVAPIVILLVLALDGLLRQPSSARGIAMAGYAAAAAVAVAGTTTIVSWTAHPEYGFIHAAEGITAYIDQHSQGRDRLLLSISGDEISLITGVPAICTDYGTWPLTERIHEYRPGWFAEWNEIDPGTLEDIDHEYRLERVTSFKAFDDEDRNELVLYRMIRK